MLKSLSVENYALIDKLELDLDSSLNIITGETGAGKSILLGALGLLLGNRADSAVVKDTGRNCVVEGAFNVSGYGLEAFFADNELDYDDQIVVRRVVSSSGKSRSYINDLPVQQNTLKELSSSLIDIHSQHQNLMLSQESFRTGILDSVAGNGKTLAEYRQLYGNLRMAEKELEAARAEYERSRQDQQWLEYQVQELQDAALRAGETELLEAEQAELSHAEEIKYALGEGSAVLDSEETGILAQLKQVKHSLSAVAGFYPMAKDFLGRIDSVAIELRDIEGELSAEAERVDCDPERLGIVNERMALLYSLQQKHKTANVEELIDIHRNYEARLAVVTEGGEAVAALEKQIAQLREQATAAARQITSSRKKASAEVSKYIEQTVSILGMPGAKFVVGIEPAEGLKSSGADEIDFLFSANKNIAPGQVSKIASGGEMSRLMLAMKSLAARKNQLPTIIFDEIDSGVSGPIADAMGNIIMQLGQTMQVINITHLPQVASKGRTHFVVYKDNAGASSRTSIARLDELRRIDEIAKMLSGSTVTDAARTQARLLLGL